MSKRSNLLASFVIKSRSLTAAVFLLLLLSPIAAFSQAPRDISITIEENIGAVQGGYLDVDYGAKQLIHRAERF